MSTVIDSNPFPLGRVAPVPGVPLPLTVNYPDLANDYVNLICIQADVENLGRCYFGNQRLNLVRGEGLIYTFQGPGDPYTLGNLAGNVYRLSDFRLDVEVPGDVLWVSIYMR